MLWINIGLVERMINGKGVRKEPPLLVLIRIKTNNIKLKLRVERDIRMMVVIRISPSYISEPTYHFTNMFDRLDTIQINWFEQLKDSSEQ
jgi:hypothetical protein